MKDCSAHKLTAQDKLQHYSQNSARSLQIFKIKVKFSMQK